MRESDLTVAVCASDSAGSATSLRGCLSALSAAGVYSPIVLRGESLSLLRNQALAACDTPFIAFVDEDIEVSRNWLASLSQAWERGDRTVGCVGGPIALEIRGEQPRWFSPNLITAPTLGQQDYEARGNDASDPTPLLGGNISFRTSALAGVGGFWPAKGAPRLRDLFGEDQLAQAELRQAGWKTIFEPGARGSRVIDAKALPLSDLLRLKRLAGARRTLVGGDLREREGISAAKSLVGSAAAMARLNQSLAAERLSRAAGHFGAVSAERTAGQSLQPARRSTEFRFSVPMPSGRSTKEEERARVLCLHRVTNDALPTGLAITPERFGETLDTLLRDGNPVSLEDATGEESPSDFALTFDDGYADNLEVALPILEDRGVPATFFIATGFIGDGLGFWWDEVARLLNRRCSSGGPVPTLELQVDGGRRSWAPQTAGQAIDVRGHINAWLQPQAPEHIAEAIDQIRTWAGPDHVGPSNLDRPMTLHELKTLAAHDLVSIGAHTRHHSCLATATDEALHAELSGGADDLEGWLGVRPKTVAYPFGVWGVDVTQRVCVAAEAAGYETGFVNGPGPGAGKRLALSRTGITGY